MRPTGANAQVATRLRQAAELLLAQGGNPFRAAAYRRAAETVASLPRDLAEIVAGPDARAALDALPGIGPSIAAAIAEMVATGRWGFLERLQGDADPETVLRTVPGIGPELAHRVHEALHVGTLEALEIAAHDGRLAAVRGFGPRRAEAVRAALAAMLARLRPHLPAVAGEEPPVALLLDLDREYRERAERGELRRIAPRRFNPTGEAWLPVLHETRGPWHLTALFSNTATAHRLGRVRDWVVIYFQHGDGPEGRRTVVTETTGAQRGRRVVRGRESEGAR
ncbi:helix-hairpin-helix domain-containing protein [Neoroseomonas oryzicola]|uniref:DNA-binding protein n=1 Tax=Neoroseomonas oryzicola TaxID=535904 RepID=A0A9X9WNK3_9PROT|nr:helix-hairpin-helix domain-containing protein [Neoroseomonas oryzicola]MBR0661913.1 DNA-binding protein [Neoroseomonas oryzicola]NKE18087.1 DNA-binding protein [Neoroseomonas oryzicola]